MVLRRLKSGTATEQARKSSGRMTVITAMWSDSWTDLYPNLLAGQRISLLARPDGDHLREHTEKYQTADISKLYGHRIGEPHLADVETGSAIGHVLHEVMPSHVDVTSEGQRVYDRRETRTFLSDLGGLEDEPPVTQTQKHHCG